MNRLTIFVLLFGCLGATSAFGQSPPAHPVIELSIGVTGMTRGPGRASENALAAMGFHNGYPNHAMTQTGLDGFWKLEIGVSERRSLGILTTRVANRTSGIRDIAGVPSTSIGVDHTVVTRAVTWSYRPNGWISVGAGPALHVRRFAIDASSGADVGVQSKRTLGAVAGVNVKWKRENGTFAHALWQYRYAGSLRSDTVTVPVSSGRPAPQTVQWPSMKIPFSHRMVGIGLGIEF
jgi:hypothetical protein